ncbi:MULTISPECIES: glycosyltransferase family 4 protein [unclassified Rhizobium]|uniref:glycosyltransferase family 4 protein n=1 Tax=unclassified Rhizobium TaxID=2613769 RepID=UPI000B1D6886|nr:MULTISPECIES: glycosyltransferase family 4 protein [unclassified Rhizobium]
MIPIRDVEIIAPNFKKRLSGVTSTIIQLIPVQRALGQKIATLGPGLPADLPHIRFRDLLQLWTPPPGRKNRVWHARRNLEMLPAIILRDLLGMKLKILFTSAAQRRHSAWTRFLIRRMDAVIATSDTSGSFLEVPHTVINHGINLEVFRAPKANEMASDPFLVGCFGRVRHQKGTDLFVRAMVELLPRYPRWSAVVCGRVTPEHTAFASELKDLVARNGLSDRIAFLGEVDDIKPWYRRLCLYVAPSRNEGFGLTPLEAMASRTAVVASDAGAYAELIAPGETGEVVPAGDYEALRAAIEIYFADPEKAVAHGLAGEKRTHDHFDISREAQAISIIYEKLLG